MSQQGQRRPKRRDYEIRQIQIPLMMIIRQLGWFAWHTPNGEARHVAVAAKLNRMGVLRGVSDVLIFEPCDRGWFGLALELKKPGEKRTDDQLLFHAHWKIRGGATAVAESLQEAVEACQIVQPMNGKQMPTWREIKERIK